MDSLEPKCTVLKNTYDACFNRCDRKRVLSQSKEQYEKECGMKWEQYHSCLNTALESRQLKPLLESARNEDPLSDPTSLQESTRQS
ncbi:hypothetical protein PSHT_00030 [Puccinia striiformis]|uniref:Uncharacterized protein n=1 Tax=Puccinia striiformis TaxID=27350 RepID=A0A2S4WP48_9BASI|nr:hypothetical protein PSHT_00030 [Puccinia striiformis]